MWHRWVCGTGGYVAQLVALGEPSDFVIYLKVVA